MAGATRSPGSSRWDARARYALNLAIRAHAIGKGAQVFVGSPSNQIGVKDRGGLTANERAFTRAIYYPVYAVPRAAGELPIWSLKLTWGGWQKRGDRWGRVVTVRLFRYSSGYRHAAQSDRQYTAGQGRSSQGSRIDE